MRVNGEIILKDGAQIDEERDEVSVNGEQVWYQRFFYLMLNKPQGVVCANDDERHETVFDLLPDLPKGAFTVGRLDLDTTGLLLITNDGQLAHQLLSPRHHVCKWYAVGLDAPLDDAALQKLQSGIDLGDFITMPAQIGRHEGNELQLGIREGKFHQVKRMMHALNREVITLHRYAFGPLQLGDLTIGEWRPLEEEEIHALKGGAHHGYAETDREEETRGSAH